MARGFRRSRILIASIVAALAAQGAGGTIVPAAADSGGTGLASINLTKTVAGTSVRPTLGLTLVPDRAKALPADAITYTATVSNTGAKLTVTGDFNASNGQDATSTVAGIWDEIEYKDSATKVWAPLGGFADASPGYAFVVAPPITTGMTLDATGAASSGVDYGSDGGIVGSVLQPGADATWSYRATLTLTAAQVRTLASSSAVGGIRNVVHYEVTPRPVSNGQPFTYRAAFDDPFLTSAGVATDVHVTIAPPTGDSATFDPSTKPALASIAPGDSVSVQTVYDVPVPAAKGADESDVDYLARLQKHDGALLEATADATAAGAVAAPTAHATVTETLPIGSVTKDGPATVDAGTTATYHIHIADVGSADARGIAVTDVTPDGSRAQVPDTPGALAPGESATVSADYPVPDSQPDGPLADTAEFAWQDANGNRYGPLLSSFTTTVASSYEGATLTLAPKVAGPDVTGTMQQLTATLLDRNGDPIAGKNISFDVIGANTASGTATTDTQGQARFSYSGAQDGTDTVQADVTLGALALQSNTASVSWVTPTVAVSTTSVEGRFFPGGCGDFCHGPNDTPAFTESFPTIDFNPPAGTVPHNITGVSVFSRPFTDITTDINGNFNGSVTAQGNGYQAGVGAMNSFDAVFTATYVVAQPGEVTFNFYSDDGFVFGVGGGATRVSGSLVNPPAATPFEGYPVLGSYDEPTSPVANHVTVHFPAAGVYPYELDYSECCGGEVALTMATNADGHGVPPAGNLNLTPDTISTQPVGQSLTTTVAAMDAGGQPVANLPVVLSVTGANQQQVSGTTDANGLAQLTYQGTNAGSDHLQVGASLSGMPAISNIVPVTWAYSVPGSSTGSSSAPPPAVGAPSPADGSTVTAPTPIDAQLTPPDGQTISSWSVSYQGAHSSSPTVLAQGTGSPPSPLATFDPTVLANDTYKIVISATASGGGTQTVNTSLAVAGQLKPGRFVTTYDDLRVPVAGINLDVQRRYDSYDTSNGDFGRGWHVALSDITAGTNRKLGDGGWTLYPEQCVFGFCTYGYSSTSPHYVTVTFPDGHSEIFDFTPDGGVGPFYFLGTARFTPRPGTTSTLQVDGDTSVDYGFDGTLSGDLGGPVYDPQRFDLTTKDGTVYTIDRTLGLVAEKDPDGNTVTIDANGVHSSAGRSITFTRDATHGNRITSIAGPSDGVDGQRQRVDYGYDGAGRLSTVTDANGNVSTYTYDPSSGDLSQALDADHLPVQTETYDADGRLATIAHGSDPPTTITVSPDAKTQTVLDPNGKLTTVYQYDDRGDVVQKDQVFGGTTLTTKFTYDAAGRVTDVEDPLHHHQSWVYDETATAANGNLLSYTDAKNRTVRFTDYDAHGHAGALLGPDGNPIATFSYDPTTGRLLQEQRPGASPSVFTYYPNGLRKTATDPAGRITSYVYNSAGYLTSQSDSLGHATTYVPDASGRNTSVTDASGNTTLYGYDGTGDITSVTDQTGLTQTFHYNARGLLDRVADPQHATTYTYNDVGLVEQRTDRNGAITTYDYDPDGKLSRETRPGNDVVSYRYDALERLVEADDSAGEVTFDYDDAGNVLRQVSCAPQPAHGACADATSTADQPKVTFDYGWTEDGLPASVTGRGGTTSYHFDGNGRLDRVTDPAGGAFGYHYDALNRLASTDLPNGLTDNFSYDPSSLLTGRDVTSGTTTVSRSDYTLDPVTARRDSMTDTDGTSSYTYQDNGWLTQATHPDGSGLAEEDYTYDGAGNVASTADVPAAAITYQNGRLTQFGNLSLQYDNEGNLVTKTDTSTSAVTRYHWNVDHELTSVDLPNGTTTTYAYDPLRRRIAVDDGTHVTRYAWDAFNLAAVYSGSNQLVASYVTMPTDAQASDVAAPAEVLEKVDGSGTSYFLHDGSESTTALTDSAGNVTSRYRYGTAGRPAATNGPEAGYTWTGAQYDRATGLYYLADRYYDPSTGRFVSEDPASARYFDAPLGRWSHRDPSADVQTPVTFNRYAYAADDPVDFTDPSGDGLRAAFAATACSIIVLLNASGAANNTPFEEPLKQVAECIQETVKDWKERQEAIELAEELAEADSEPVAAFIEDAVAEELVEIEEITVEVIIVEEI